jgi:hypothetical protein
LQQASKRKLQQAYEGKPQQTFEGKLQQDFCSNLNLGLVTKARVCKVVGQEESPRITFHVPESAKECEGMNPHTSK